MVKKKEKENISQKHHHNTNMFSLPPRCHFVDISWLSKLAFFQTLNFGTEGILTRNQELACLFSWKARSFIFRYGRDLRYVNETTHLPVLQKKCQFLRHQFFLLIFVPNCISKEIIGKEDIPIFHFLGLCRVTLKVTLNFKILEYM